MLKRIAYVAYWILLTATCLGTVTMGACQLGPGGGPLGPSGGGGTSLPAGFTFLSTTSCPTGYTAVVGSSGKFVLLGATGGAMGGADQITPTGSVTAPTFTGSSGTVPAETFTGSALAGHTHTLTASGMNSAPTFTGDAFDNRPAYLTRVRCKKTGTDPAPVPQAISAVHPRTTLVLGLGVGLLASRGIGWRARPRAV